MDKGRQPLTGAEQQQMNKEAAVEQAEAETGTTAIPRTTATQDPTTIDPRFDKDDLRQGKPPPAVRQRHLPRKIKIRRPRAKKGLPIKTKNGENVEGATVDGEEVDEADMTDDEVEVEGDEDEATEEKDEGKKKGGLLGKVLGKNTTL